MGTDILSLSYAHDYVKGALPFPQNTRGFLYYYAPLDIPSCAREIRFRLTRWQDPNCIVDDDAKDLMLPDGSSWGIPLLRIAVDNSLLPFRLGLMKLGLANSKLIEKCRKIAEPHAAALSNPNKRLKIIHSISQPFAFDFEKPFFSMWLLTRFSLGRVLIKDLYGTHPMYKGEHHRFHAPT